MNAGRLIVTSNGRENIVDVIYVENNDNQRIGDLINLNSFDSDAINGFDALGKDLALTDFIARDFINPVNVDCLEASQLFLTFSDSGQMEYSYELNITLIYEEERIITYEEAKKIEEAQKDAVNVILQKKIDQ